MTEQLQLGEPPKEPKRARREFVAGMLATWFEADTGRTPKARDRQALDLLTDDLFRGFGAVTRDR